MSEQLRCAKCGKAYWWAQSWQHDDAHCPPVANEATNSVANTYRYRDVEKRRAYQRDLMRKRRSA